MIVLHCQSGVNKNSDIFLSGAMHVYICISSCFYIIKLLISFNDINRDRSGSVAENSISALTELELNTIILTCIIARIKIHN